MNRFLNNEKGIALIAAIIFASLGLIIITGVTHYIVGLANNLRFIESKIALNSYIQDIQTGLAHPETCIAMVTSRNGLDMNLLDQDYADVNLPRPGQPVRLQLITGDIVEPTDGTADSGLFADDRLRTEHLSWSNRQPLGRDGPNGFPLHEVTLTGAFSLALVTHDQMLFNGLIGTVYLEIDPAGNSIQSCYGKADATTIQAQNQCQRLGGDWNAGTSMCTFTAIAPAPEPNFGPPPPASTGLGADCGGDAAGLVRRFAGNLSDPIRFQQCRNGSWRTIMSLDFSSGDAGG